MPRHPLQQRIVSIMSIPNVPASGRFTGGMLILVCREDRGLNPIFENHAEEAIKYTKEMQRDLRRREHRPDRIMGLYQTGTIERLLEKPDQRHAFPSKTVGQTIRTTPFRKGGEKVVFPFLVIEAKSEKSQSSFSGIDMQTAFAIRELVVLQEELERAASGLGHAKWDAAPLVWYISYRGEQWRLHAAFPRPQGDTGAVVRCSSPTVNGVKSTGAINLLIARSRMWLGCGAAT
ncbi:hypothetical protein IMZ48_01585 [Candidatus Bathyarchaeota archaeon]|nr:hypothetical protein [Candidatus Bathyarchaeota archaeon]